MNSMGSSAEFERRHDHVVVNVGHCILAFGGSMNEACETENLLSNHVIWAYNLYTEKWKKFQISQNKTAPPEIYQPCAVAIGANVYMFGGTISATTDDDEDTETNEMWELSKTTQGSFMWREIEFRSDSEVPSPRSGHTGWSYDGNLWIFGGMGPDPISYLNVYGNFVFGILEYFNNQLLRFSPSMQQWSCVGTSGSVPAPRSAHAAAMHEDTTWVYGGCGNDLDTLNDLYELNLRSLTWTKIDTPQPKPNGLTNSSLNVTANLQLIVHGGTECILVSASSACRDTWILDLPSLSWRRHSIQGYRRCCHTGSLGINNNVIVIGGKGSLGNIRGVSTFKIMLESKSLQQLAMQVIHKHHHVLSLESLPKTILKRFLFL